MSQIPTAVFPSQVPYLVPDFRSPSPPTSLCSSDPGHDETTISENELDDDALARKVTDMHALNEISEEERRANEDPKLPVPTSEIEERQLYERVRAKLRAAVEQLEEDERFEQLATRGARIETQPKPMSANLDVILQSLMGQSVPVQPQYHAHIQPTSERFGSPNFYLEPIPPPETPAERAARTNTAAAGQPARRAGRSRK